MLGALHSQYAVLAKGQSLIPTDRNPRQMDLTMRIGLSR